MLLGRPERPPTTRYTSGLRPRVGLAEVWVDRETDQVFWRGVPLVKWAGPAFDWRAYEQDAWHVHRYLVECIVTAFVESFYGSDAALVLQDRLREGRSEGKAATSSSAPLELDRTPTSPCTQQAHT